MAQRVLLVGGSPAPWHRMEPAEGPLGAALEGAGLAVDATGIYHPDGGDTWIGDYAAINRENLQGYQAVCLYTTGEDPQGADVDALVAWVRQGGALIGVHNATDSFMDHQEYIRLIGGRFREHPPQMDISIEVVDPSHPIAVGAVPFAVHDELYLFADYEPARVNLLAHTRSVLDGGQPVPICWTREEEQGRVFYLSLGHNPETMEHPGWRRMFARGVAWTLRREQMPDC